MNTAGVKRALLLLLLPAAAGASCPEAEPAQSLDVAYRLEQLTPSAPDWTDYELAYTYKFDRRRVLFGRITQTSRFDVNDTTVAGGAYWPLSDNDTVNFELAGSPTHDAMPQGSLLGAWNHIWGDGWGTEIGVKQIHYETVDVTLGTLMLEKYWGPFRFAYAYGPSHSSTAGNEDGHRLQAGWFYGAFSSLQLIVSRGTELDKPTSASAVNATDVSSAALVGLHDLNAFGACEWGIGWSLGYTENRGKSDGERRAYGLFVRRRF